jgi:hypothetical protein
MAPATKDLSAAKQAHRQTVESSPGDMARFLQDALGQKLLAYITNVSGPRTVARWVSDERKPGPEAERRLRAAFYIFRLLSEVESSYVVRSWFAGLNPLLDEVAPATVIREGSMQEALAAAKAFVSDA